MRNDDVEIFAIGTELVTGLILDTNSHWLAGEVAVAGGDVRRITALADDLDALTAELRAAVARRARVIITTGGLGPTPDDLTVEAVAELAGGGVHTPREVLEDYARRRGISLEEASSPPRLKMGTVPAAARVHINPVGWAPCFMVQVEASSIWCTPGPPREVEGCFRAHIQPVVERMFAGQSARLRVFIDAHESETSPLMQSVMRRIPSAYLKAYVGMSKPQGLPVDIVVRSMDGVAPKDLLQQTYDEFCAVAAASGKTVTMEAPPAS